jgi:hypothetical protein
MLGLCLTPFQLAMAQHPAGRIGVYADAGAGACTLDDSQPRAFDLFVVHTDMDGMLSSRFRVVESSGFTATYVGESIATNLHFGDLHSGIDVIYDLCSAGSLLLATISYDGHGTSEPCSTVEIAEFAPSTTGQPETMDCNFGWFPAAPFGPLLVNPTDQCSQWCVVATEATTWGRVKALYRE